MSEITKYWKHYKVIGLPGSWLQSNEKGVVVGEVRFIANCLMYAYSIYPRGWFTKPEINWIPVSKTLDYRVEVEKWERAL